MYESETGLSSLKQLGDKVRICDDEDVRRIICITEDNVDCSACSTDHIHIELQEERYDSVDEWQRSAWECLAYSICMDELPTTLRVIEADLDLLRTRDLDENQIAY